MIRKATNKIKVELAVESPGCVLGIMDELADIIERAMTHNKELTLSGSIETVEKKVEDTITPGFMRDEELKTYLIGMDIEVEEEAFVKSWLDDCIVPKSDGSLKTEDKITLTDNLCRHCKKPIKPYDYIYEVLPPYMPYTFYRKQHVYLCERCHQDFLSFRSQVIEMAKKYETMKIESFLGLKQDE